MFDLDLVKRNGTRETFVGIDKSEQEVIIDYFTRSNVVVKKIVEDAPNYKDEYEDDGDLMEDENSEEDGDFMPDAKGEESSYDEDFKADEESMTPEEKL